MFSRSELRREAAKKNIIEHYDECRPRVKKWAWCTQCGEVCPLYKMEVDHKSPVIPLDKTFEDMSWDELISRLWCSVDNLDLLCNACHDIKSKDERKIRSINKKRKQNGA